MIFDNIKNCEIYYGMNPKFKKAFEFINRAIKEGLDKGKYEIEGNEVYAIVQKYQTEHKDIKKFEGHKKYIDIQCMLNGIEILDSDDNVVCTPCKNLTDKTVCDISMLKGKRVYFKIFLKNASVCAISGNIEIRR